MAITRKRGAPLFGDRGRRPFALSVLALLALVTAACSDRPAVTAPLEASGTPLFDAEGRGVFQRYVAIGTSVSMGWQSDGVIAATQATAWPAQLARMGGREITLPYVDVPGCRSPLIAPLVSFTRLSGESAGADPSKLSCAANRAGVVLPTRDVAINAATTMDALYTTPENVTDPANAKLYARVLAPGQSQVTAMMAQNPKLVSVELGGNEVLNARSGIAIEGVTLVPFAEWAPLYDAVLDSVDRVSRMGLVVGLVNDVTTFPAFRKGNELWMDRAAFLAAFNVSVSQDCQGSSNLLFVPVRVPSAVANGLTRKAQGLGPYTLTCAAGGPTDQDFVLTPSEVATVNALMGRMTAHIHREARRRGYAHFDLESLYGRADVKPPFSVVQLMTTSTPYGDLISLDGVHPSAKGAAVLANAAFAALDEQYPSGLFSRTVAAGAVLR